MNLNIPEIKYQILYYNDGDLIHKVETDFIDAHNIMDTQIEIIENLPYQYDNVEVVEKEFLGYQVKCYQQDRVLGSLLVDVFVVKIEPFLKYRDSKFKLVQIE